MLVASLLFAAYCYEKASAIQPAPESETAYDGSGFPQVDWDYWQIANPDVIGWITVPNTPIDYPVVQAPVKEPDYYLTHDVYRKWNYAGCPYLDASCAEGGLLGGKNSVVFGHNLGHGDTSLFATVSFFTDDGFARTHRRVLVQTPETKAVYAVKGASCIPGAQATKRTTFADNADFQAWLQQRLDECSMVLDGKTAETNRVLTLCTCSYSRWENERTLIYAAPTSN